MSSIIKKLYYFIYFKYLKFKSEEIKSKLAFCGSNVSLHHPLVIHGGEHVKLNNNVVINSFVHIWGNGGLEIGENSMVASHVSITTLTHDKNTGLYNEKTISKKVLIGSNVWIGSHAIILPGVSIGNNAIIGAGALVNRDVRDGDIVAGVPAKSIKQN
ncbi:acyltransferase [Desertivirga arenae]|uniref:acyltransferase n=1 Tax=Desertivirga arenae TaxID=2810309 RepID=UPI001A975516|nr:acyltransferase [Pedobacter sp. SYSU D00823]